MNETCVVVYTLVYRRVWSLLLLEQEVSESVAISNSTCHWTSFVIHKYKYCEVSVRIVCKHRMHAYRRVSDRDDTGCIKTVMMSVRSITHDLNGHIQMYPRLYIELQEGIVRADPPPIRPTNLMCYFSNA